MIRRVQPSNPSTLMKRFTLLALFPLGLLLGGCIHVSMDPIKVHAVVDVNVKVDRALTDFFEDLDKQTAEIAVPAKP